MTPMYASDKVILFPFREEDVDSLTYQSWFHNQEVTRYNSHGLFPLTAPQRREFAEGLGRDRLVLKIGEIKRGIPIWIGNVSLQSFNWINRSAELAIVIGDTTAHGKGYGTEACRMIVDHGFQKMNLNRIWTGTAELNHGMDRVATAIGMTREGRSRQGMYLDGKYVDVFHYGILRWEWEKSNEIKNNDPENQKDQAAE